MVYTKRGRVNKVEVTDEDLHYCYWQYV